MTRTDSTSPTGSGQGAAHATTPGTLQTPAPRWAPALTALGAAVIAATYVAVLLTQPDSLAQGLGTTALWVVGGYLAGGALIAVGTIPLIPARVYGLLPVAIALNVVIGQIIGTLTPVPLYLDSIGTVLVGVLAGPASGALTGVLSNLIWGVTLGPSLLPFTAGAAFIGAAAGWAARLGLFRRVWSAVVAGAVVGVPAGAIAAPVAAYVYGGGLGVGTGSVVATLQAAGLEMISATTVQSLASDTADKAIVFAIAALVVRSLPRRVTRGYPFSRWSLPTES